MAAGGVACCSGVVKGKAVATVLIDEIRLQIFATPTPDLPDFLMNLTVDVIVTQHIR